MNSLYFALIFIFLVNNVYAYDSNVVDKVHHSVTRTWDNANNGLDTFFSNKTFSEEESEGYLRISFSRRINEHGPSENSFDFRMKTSFPSTTKKLKFVIKDDDIDDELNRTTRLSNGDTTQTNLEGATTASNYSAILQYEFFDKRRWKITTNQGMRLDLPLNPFVQLRVRFKRDITLAGNEIELNLVQHLQYYYQEKFSENSEIQLYKKLTDNLALTFSTGMTWTTQNKLFSIGHGLSLHQKLSDLMAINYSANASAQVKDLEYNNLACAVSITRLLYKKWFYGTLSVGSNFSRVNGFYSNNYLYYSTSILF